MLLLPVASLSTIPNERSEWFNACAGPHGVGVGGAPDNVSGGDGGESAMGGQEEEEYEDGPAVGLDGGLPWLQLMDDLKFLAPYLELSFGIPVLEIPVALKRRSGRAARLPFAACTTTAARCSALGSSGCA